MVNGYSKQWAARLLPALVVSVLFTVIAINLFYKTPHGVLSIYSLDRFFFGLSALDTEQFSSFLMVLGGYWVCVAIYALAASYIVKSGSGKTAVIALLLGIDTQLTLSLSDLAASNTNWSLQYNTYYDPLFIYPLLGIYVISIFAINILISRYIILSVTECFKKGGPAAEIDGIALFLLPIPILTIYSIFQLRFNWIILLLIFLISISGIFETPMRQALRYVWSCTRGILNYFQNERIFLVTVAVSAILIRIAFSLANQTGMGADDSSIYDDLGWRYASGEDVTDVFFPPGYWMFLGIIYKVFGRNYLLLMIIQSLIGAAVPILTYFISKEIFNIKTARLSALLVSINSSIIFYSTLIATESIYTPITLLLLWMLIKVRKSPRTLFFVFIGLLLGLSIIIKSVMLALPMVLLGWLFLIYRRSIKTFIISSVLLLVFVCLTIAPLTYRNYINHGRFILLTEFRQVKDTLMNPVLKEADIYGDTYGEMLKKITGDPVKFTTAFIKGAPLQLRELFWGRKIYVPFDLIYIHNASPYAFNLKVYFTLLFFLGAFAAVFIDRRLRMERVLPLLLITYYCVMYIFFYGKSRYAMPMLPLTIMFGVFGFYYILTEIKRVFKLSQSYGEKKQRETIIPFRIALWGWTGLIVLIMYGLSYGYNVRAKMLLAEGKGFMEAGNYTEAKEKLQTTVEKYPKSASAQDAYRELILSGARYMDLSKDSIEQYFMLYKGYPTTIETFKEFVDIFQKNAAYYLERLHSSSDIEKFIRMLDFQEAVILNMADNYPYEGRIVGITCKSLYNLQNMRSEARLRAAENFLKDRMPDLADKEVKVIADLPERVVFSQWFVYPVCNFSNKARLLGAINDLYLQYGFKSHALKWIGISSETSQN
ncbi:MAG: hypothetical protein A2132_01650 [Nitrospirae bacterium RBG_16_43_11]|nr:MAG: hypothetical protein A2132_01650 [Nitrospirae bacterium RBG_16_43_11]